MADEHKSVAATYLALDKHIATSAPSSPAVDLRTIGGDEAQVLGVVVSVETVCAEGILTGRSAGTSKRMNMRSSPFSAFEKHVDTSLHGQLHAAHEIVEARVGAQAVQTGIDLYQRESCRALLVCLLEPEERLLLVFQAGMN
jgi:hypothetical protein